MSQLPDRLTALFKYHCIVFWYGNDDPELHKEFDELSVRRGR